MHFCRGTVAEKVVLIPRQFSLLVGLVDHSHALSLGLWNNKPRIAHSERDENALTEKLVQRRARCPFDYCPKQVC